jgi:hypothetical protein
MVANWSIAKAARVWSVLKTEDEFDVNLLGPQIAHWAYQLESGLSTVPVFNVANCLNVAAVCAGNSEVRFGNEWVVKNTTMMTITCPPGFNKTGVIDSNKYTHRNNFKLTEAEQTLRILKYQPPVADEKNKLLSVFEKKLQEIKNKAAQHKKNEKKEEEIYSRVSAQNEKRLLHLVLHTHLQIQKR